MESLAASQGCDLGKLRASMLRTARLLAGRYPNKIDKVYRFKEIERLRPMISMLEQLVS